jgi:hypothetical protein
VVAEAALVAESSGFGCAAALVDGAGVVEADWGAEDWDAADRDAGDWDADD